MIKEVGQLRPHRFSGQRSEPICHQCRILELIRTEGGDCKTIAGDEIRVTGLRMLSVGVNPPMGGKRNRAGSQRDQEDAQANSGPPPGGFASRRFCRTDRAADHGAAALQITK